jgi:hypothetical protein
METVGGRENMLEARTANYAIRTMSGVGGALPKGRPYPDLHHPAFSTNRPLMYLCKMLEMSVW